MKDDKDSNKKGNSEIDTSSKPKQKPKNEIVK